MARNRHAPAAAGFTILEAVVALAILMVGALGVISIENLGSRMNRDGRVMTRASAIGADLVTQIQTWNYFEDPRLQDTNTSNNTDVVDAEALFEGPVSGLPFDHEESELASGPWNGISSADVQALGFTRYWNVAPFTDPATGAVLGLQIAVIVRWENLGAPRRIVFATFVRDPGVTLD
jgi:hypothetical protein